VFAAAIILWRLHRTRRRSPAMIVPSTRPHPNWWKPLVLAGIAIFLLDAATGLYIRTFRLQEAAKHPLDDLVPRLNGWPAAMLFATVVIAGPVVEEWLFRGGLFGRFRAHGYAASGAILSALAFALGHCIPVLIPNYFCCGLILAWLCHRTGSLWPPVALHAAMNSFYFVVARL
jgi:hypothetical protein